MPQSLKRMGLAKGPADGVRILGNGELTKKLVGQGASLLQVGRREDRGQGRHHRGDSAAQEAGRNKMKPQKPSAEGYRDAEPAARLARSQPASRALAARAGESIAQVLLPFSLFPFNVALFLW